MYQRRSYLEAQTLEEAIVAASEDNGQIIAGGTDVLIKSRERKNGYVNKDWVGIMRIPELKEIKKENNGDIFIGATATFKEVETHPIVGLHLASLGTACGTAGGPQLRNAGTIGGNICNGATSADTASTLCAFDAILKLVGPNGERQVSINGFYKGPGQVDLKKGEILKGFIIEEKNYKGYHGHYIKFSQRKAMDIATLGCSVLVKEKEGSIEDLKIAFGVAGPTPLRATEAEAFGKNKKISEENLNAIGEKCIESTRARDSWRASKAFREQLIKTLPVRGLEIALGGEQYE